MRNYFCNKRNSFYSFILLILLSAISFQASAVDEIRSITKKGNDLLTFPLNTAITNADPVFGTSGWNNQQAFGVQNIVLFEIDFNNTDNIYFQSLSFTATCTVDILCYGNPASPGSATQSYTNISLQVNHNPASGATFKGIADYKFNGAYRVDVLIKSITATGLSPLSNYPIFSLTNKMIVNRQYNFSDNTTDILSYTTDGKKLNVSWVPTNYEGAESFDLEWTYVDALSSYGTMIGNAGSSGLPVNDLENIFRNNSSRVNVPGGSYAFNLNYNQGYILFRLRGVQFRNSDGIRMESNWNYNAQALSGSIYTYFNQGIVQVDWHEQDLNWQYNSVYAEDGKKKEVISYFDGALRSRQTVTLNNEDNVSVVAEPVYDALGRPAMSILPAPVSTNELKYYRSFNINNALKPISYKDIPNTNCSITASPLNSSSGVEQYYSANNPFLSDLNKPWNKAIPKSEGFPFTVTQYTPDNTGRIRAQSGVGLDFQLGSGHETKYYYGKPSQYELDRLFGAEAGEHLNYLKNMVQDANGQVSISYQNSEGKTIATALAGIPPTNLEALGTAGEPTTTVRDIMITPSSFHVNNARSSLEATNTFLVASTGNYQFTYKFTPEQYTENYSGGTLCYTCSYDLLITLKDECGAELQRIETNNITPFNTSCITPTEISSNFTVPINKIGEYTAYFELVVKKETLDAYTEHYLESNTDIKKLNYFLLEQLIEENLAECYSDCQACQTLPPTQAEFISLIEQYYEREGLPFGTAETNYASQLYTTIQGNCAILGQQCLQSPCDEILEVIKADVTPGGQYAEFDADYNLIDPEINALRNYQNPLIPYSPSSVEDENGNMVPVTSLSLKDFILKFEDSWAVSLAPYHPEYCYYTWCTMNPASQTFNQQLENLHDPDEAMTLGYFDRYNPLALLENDPFFTSIYGAPYYGSMEQDLQNYSTDVLGLTSQSTKDIFNTIDFVLYCGNQDPMINWDNCSKSPADPCRSDYKEWLLYKEWYLDRKVKYYTLAMKEALPECNNCFIPSSSGGDPVGMTTCIAPPASYFSIEEVQNSSVDGVKRINIKYKSGNEVMSWPVSVTIQMTNTLTNFSLTQEIIFVPGFGSQEMLVQDEFNSFSILEVKCADLTAARTSEQLAGDKRNTSVSVSKIENKVDSKGEEWECPENDNYFNFSANFNSTTQRWDFQVCYVGPAIPPGKTIYINMHADNLACSYSEEFVAKVCSGQTCFTYQSNATSTCTDVWDLNSKGIECKDEPCPGACPDKDLFTATDQSVSEACVSPFPGMSAAKITVTYTGGPIVLTPPIERVKVKVKIITVNSQTGKIFTDYRYVWFSNGESIKEFCYYYPANRSFSSVSIESTECKGACPGGDCCDDPRYSLYEGKVRRFQDYVEPDFTAIQNSQYNNTNNATTYPLASCKNECEAMADMWIQDLKNCTTDLSRLERVRRQLIDVCKQSCVIQSQQGATVVHPYSDNNPTPSFESVIIAEFGSLTPDCAYDLISDPYPWGKAPIVERTFATEASTEVCTKLQELINEAQNEGYNNTVADVHQYLTLFYSPYYDLDEAELGLLFTACDECDGIMKLPVELPPFMNGDAKDCIPCNEYQQLKTQFLAKYPGITPAHDKYEVLFRNYLNHQTGFSHAFATYYDFEEKCIANENDFQTYGRICETPLLMEAEINPTNDCMDEKFLNALSNAMVIYTRYIEEVKRIFRNNYTAKCLTAKPQLESEAKLYEYHYTLYYYDQSSNLVKTVPPKGVAYLTGTEIATLWTDRNQFIVPAHTLATTYQYNSFNQVVKQYSPDGGTSEFWYDRLGRLTVSQNEEQKTPVNGGASNRYSYTKYEPVLGRITEVGEKSGAAAITSINTRDDGALQSWLASGTDIQITSTIYDKKDVTQVANTAITNEQQFYTSRKRVVSTIFRKIRYSNPAEYDAATHYSYDILGNAKTVWQENERLKEADASTQGLKRMDYEFDLVSGKVNKVWYQKNKGDQYIYVYEYDAENRVIAAKTSRDGLLWQNDASYKYYLHGPLARTELGNLKVQGTDYGYTLQGWMKYINAPALNEKADIGRDGNISQPNPFATVARDALAYSISYFNGEYKPIAAGSPLNYTESIPNSMGTGKDLFNGNIRATTVHIAELGTAKTYSYSYDQLNRIVKMRKHETSYSDATPSITIAAPTSEYQEDVTYDPNGNILTYLRNGTAAQPAMDNLTYNYIANKNQLEYVQDGVTATNYAKDIDNQLAGNYEYDKIGNLVKDVAEKITKIEWTVYGKIRKITKNDANSTTIEYEYDAAGNRIYKKVTSGGSTEDITKHTYYVRDASGNTMAIYTRTNTAAVQWEEQHLYGSSRLGMATINTPVPANAPVPGPGAAMADGFDYGKISYELSNHLGNVLVTISDKKIAMDGTIFSMPDGYTDYFMADVVTATDYYPFGMQMPGRKYEPATGYRYSINGQEKTPEIAPNTTTAEFWQYDARVGRRWNVDPKPNIAISPYNCFAGNPIFYSDIFGDTLNFDHIYDNNRVSSDALVKDLAAKTGLRLSVNETTKLLEYDTENGKPIIETDENGKLVGSKSARNELIKMIVSNQIINVKDGSGEGSHVEMIDQRKGHEKYTNNIFIDDFQINSAIHYTSKDLNSTTFGYALTFFHERGHTIYGGENPDPYGNPKEVAGLNERLPNKIRRELGKDYGQRLVYIGFNINNGPQLIPFTAKALDDLQNGKHPTGGFIIEYNPARPEEKEMMNKANK